LLMFDAGAGVDISSGGLTTAGASGSAGTLGMYRGPTWPHALSRTVAATAPEIRIERGK